MTESRQLLQHFLAALAYRTQKALRNAPGGFAEFRAFPNVRTPNELLRHMTGVIGYARTVLHGGIYAPEKLESFDAEIDRFHTMLAALHRDFADPSLRATISDEQFLQGPLSDAMTHAGQLAMLRRFAGRPVPSENFIFADVQSDNVGRMQADPRAPDAWWHPDDPPPSPGPDHPALSPESKGEAPNAVLIIGIDPDAVAHLGVDANMVNAALAGGQARFVAAGIPVDMCLIGLDQQAAVDQITRQLQSRQYDCVVIGGGVRKPEPMLEFFEIVINLVHRYAPNSAIAFNTNPGTSLDAARRWLHRTASD